MRHGRQMALVVPLRPAARGLIDQLAPHLVDPRRGLDAVALAEQPGQAGVGDRDVQRVGIVVGDVLPVDRARPERDPPLRHQLLQPVGRELMGIGCDHLGHARAVRHEPHEHEAEADLQLDRGEAMPRRIEVAIARLERHADQPASQIVGPGMVGADQAPALAGRAIDQPGGAVAADIVEAADHAVLAADHDDAFAQIIEGVVAAGRGQVVLVADHLPGGAEQTLPLDREELGIGIEPGRQADWIVRPGIARHGHRRLHRSTLLHDCIIAAAAVNRRPGGHRASARRSRPRLRP